MKSFTVSIIMLLAVVLVLAGVLVAGCTQSSDSTSTAAANGQQAAPAGTSPGSGGSNGSSYAGSGNYGNHMYSGQSFLTNTTLLNAAAAQLGVSEQALQNALTPASGQRINFTDAANQLNVTPAQLRAALGFQAGTFHHGNQSMAMMTPATGQ